MELTNKAIGKLIEKTAGKYNTVRVGLTGGGCAGMEYVFNFEKFFEESATHLLNEALRAKLEDEFGVLE